MYAVCYEFVFLGKRPSTMFVKYEHTLVFFYFISLTSQFFNQMYYFFLENSSIEEHNKKPGFKNLNKTILKTKNLNQTRFKKPNLYNKSNKNNRLWATPPTLFVAKSGIDETEMRSRSSSKRPMMRWELEGEADLITDHLKSRLSWDTVKSKEIGVFGPYGLSFGFVDVVRSPKLHPSSPLSLCFV